MSVKPAGAGHIGSSTTNSMARQHRGPADPDRVRATFHADLFDEWLPFMDAYVIDENRGGFPCAVWPDGRRESDHRMTWFEGRGLWVYAHLYRVLDRNDHYLDVAERTLRLLDQTQPRGRPSGRPRHLNADGTAASDPDHEVYSDLFVAEGIAAFAGATDDTTLWQQAAAIVLDSLTRFRQPGYRPETGYMRDRLGRPVDRTRSVGLRPLGVWMVVIRSLTELLGHRDDAGLRDELRSAIDTVLVSYLHQGYHLLNEVPNLGGRTDDRDTSEFVYLGHAIETLWIIMDAAVVLRDRTTLDTAIALFHRHCQVARDPVYGGMFRALENVQEGTYSLDKTLWVQEEAALGALLVTVFTGADWASALFTELAEYVHVRFPLRELGSPLWREVTDRTASAIQERGRVENYHHPRFLMRVLALLDAAREPDTGVAPFV